MTYSPEFTHAAQPQTIELLRGHDLDLYGYVEHAAAALEWMPESDQNEAHGLVAQYASNTHDAELMKACIDKLDTPGQWRIFAHEVRHKGSALDTAAIVSMSEAAVECEMIPEGERDWWALSNIYASQLDIAAHGDLEITEPFERFSSALNRLKDNPEDVYKSDNLRRDTVHMLLRAGQHALAAGLIEGTSNGTHRQEYEESLPLYRRKQAGKSLTLKQLTDHNWDVFCDLDPEMYMKALEEQVWRHDKGGVAPRLRSGHVGLARRRYDDILKAGNPSQLSRLRMALEMASAELPQDTNEQELALEVTRLMSIARQVGEGTYDIGVNLKQRQLIKEQVRLLCGKIGELPASSGRIKLTLEVAAVRHEMLQGSQSSAQACDKLIFETWRQVVQSLTTDSAQDRLYQPQVRDLWWKFREVGFNFKKLKEIDSLFAEYYHPRFRSAGAKL